jgi:hypothetical protein
MGAEMTKIERSEECLYEYEVTIEYIVFHRDLGDGENEWNVHITDITPCVYENEDGRTFFSISATRNEPALKQLQAISLNGLPIQHPHNGLPGNRLLIRTVFRLDDVSYFPHAAKIKLIDVQAPATA